MSDGYIYVIKHPNLRGLKIGYSRKGGVYRVRDANCWCPDNAFSVVKEWRFEMDVCRVERLIHRCFIDYQLEGEWFDIAEDEAIEFIHELATQDRHEAFRRCYQEVTPCS